MRLAGEKQPFLPSEECDGALASPPRVSYFGNCLELAAGAGVGDSRAWLSLVICEAPSRASISNPIKHDLPGFGVGWASKKASCKVLAWIRQLRSSVHLSGASERGWEGVALLSLPVQH